jgi:DsbC/DsbD-like thiol-disulfide interchange protein/cytochrome c biogenesis protein CcdA/thiol-disulfide isomerase/thioredoxin
MVGKHTFIKLICAIFLIAIQAINTPATAQNGTQVGLNSSNKSVLTTERVRAELLAHAPQGIYTGVLASNDDKITPNTVWVGLQLAHQPKWHTYWKNSGDSGLPTQLSWTLPVGVMAGDIAWPAPKKIKIGSLTNFGYEGTVLLAVPLTITSAFKPSLLNSSLDIKLKAQWLVCKEECIPEEGEFALSIPTKGSTAINSAVFEGAFKAQPKPLLTNAGAGVPASRALVEGNALKFEVQGLPAELRGKTLDVYPETAEVLENSAINSESGKQEWQGAVWRISLPLSAQRSQSPANMPLVLKSLNQTDSQSWRADVAVQGAWPKVVAAATVSPGLAVALAENTAAQNVSPNANLTAAPVNLTLLAALLGALLGGLILNLMPCVFPVLALKVVGFTQHAADKAAHRRSGMAYFAGVVLSFVALGALFLALRAAGEQLGWGFQLQNPLVVAGLALLFTILGLNLAGVFEFGNVLPSSVATARAKNPTVDSFLSGVLAVAIASPCTAPFMGASLGFALGLPAFEALLIFAAIGVGMALPYLVASFIPAVVRILPRPGAWMNTFKKLMAIPMFATVVWLVWVLGQQLPLFDTSSEAKAQQISGELWQPWQPGSVDQLLASGKPVFVDFTAAWCVTCQFNKKTTLSKPELLAEFDAKKVQLLRADWTRRDPAIGAALKDLGRSGVPVYVLYAPGKAPQVLSEIISVDDVKAALGKI